MVQPLLPGELEAARDAWDSLMPDTLQRQTVERVPDGSGGYTETPTLGAAVPTRVAPLGAGNSGSPEEILAGRLGLVEAWVVTVPVGTTLDEADTIVINGTRPMQVVSVLAPRSYDQATRVLAQEVE